MTAGPLLRVEMQTFQQHSGPVTKAVPDLPKSLSERSLDETALKVDPELPLWRSVLVIATPFFFEEPTRKRARTLALACVAFLAAETAMMLYYSDVNKRYMSALQEKDADGFYRGLRTVGVLIVTILPILGLQMYYSQRFTVEWRVALTNRLAGRYFTDNMFYKVQQAGDVDNPDQRLCQDISDFVDITFKLVQACTGTLFSVLGFVGVLWSISPTACLGTMAYAGVGSLISTRGFAPWIMKYQFLCVKQEADMRYSLIRTRENAESIAFFRGGSAERDRFQVFFGKLVNTLYRRIVVNVCFGMFNKTFNFATFAVPSLLVAPAYLRGDVEFGAISQAHMAFNVVLGGLTLIMSQMQDLSDLAVRVKRLRVLEEVLQREEERAELARMPGIAGSSCIALQDVFGGGSSTVLGLEAVTVQTPPRQGAMQRTLVQELSLKVRSGESVLIVGDSGIGKSSLLRAIAGLWSDGCGSVARPLEGKSFFLPQKPYMFLGTLREQLLYPFLDDDDVDDGVLRQAFEDTNLGHLLESHDFGSTKEWASILSGGEQQRINFSRVLLQPGLELALVDEGTSACDAANEARLYEILKQRVKSYVSVGHRHALRKYHTHVLWLQRATSDVGAAQNCVANCSFLPMAAYEKIVGLDQKD